VLLNTSMFAATVVFLMAVTFYLYVMRRRTRLGDSSPSSEVGPARRHRRSQALIRIGIFSARF
jgi:hypothetical protein